MRTVFRDIVKYQNGSLYGVEDEIAVEEFLQIFVNGEPYAVIMRLPGDDLDLVRGFCYTEGLVRKLDEIEWMDHCPEEEGQNKVLVELSRSGNKQAANSLVTDTYVSRSSCGLCGKTSLEDIYFPEKGVERISNCSVQGLINLKQDFDKNILLFPRTGYTHSAAIYSREGELLAFAEDVGRHNAMDKTIGRVLLKEKEEEAYAGLVSSRLSFEMVQKAVGIGLEIFAGISAPSSLAVQISSYYNMTLVGFLREGRMNIYTLQERILGEAG
ncbi:MAG: formate dehydrogenase accessory sulfurtransferase FdhD [Thermodesulfobacteriota bacterium]